VAKRSGLARQKVGAYHTARYLTVGAGIAGHRIRYISEEMARQIDEKKVEAINKRYGS
jgi:hypothetical protein